MQVTELNQHFGLPGILHFDSQGELTRAQVTLPNTTATIYLHGAHLAHWQPAGEQPVLYLSPRSDFAPGKPIRGGIPVCFPWFANRGEGKPGPAHGFARLQDWTLAAAALLPKTASSTSDALHLTFTLGPSEQSRQFGFDNFRLAYEVILGKDAGRTLTLRLSVANIGDAPLKFEEALHTYFHIGDIHQVELTGLESSPYLDKTDDFKRKTTPASPLKITGRTDRVFPGATAPVTIHDEANHRLITNTKTGSHTTVAWNPWSDGSATLPDLAPDSWLSFVCVETVNAGVDALTLAPREASSMQTDISVHPA